jgi:hypothetical protein
MGKRSTKPSMKTSEETIGDGVINPFSRLLILLFGSWMMGSLYPIPETVYYLIVGPQPHGAGMVIHTPRWLDFQFLPVLGSLFSDTVLVSGPVAVFCVVCSALDRWDWKKVTLLSGLSTTSMNILESWPAPSTSWITLTLAQLLLVGIFLLMLRLKRDE